MFSSRSFIVSGLTFSSLIHFEFIFVYGVRKWSSFILLQVVDQISQHHLLKRLSLIRCIFLPPLSKIRCPYVCGFISGQRQKYRSMEQNTYTFIYTFIWASLVAQTLKNLPECMRPRFNSCIWKISYRRDRLPTPVFLDFPGGSGSKESTCNAGDLGLIPGSGRSPGGGYGTHSSILS